MSSPSPAPEFAPPIASAAIGYAPPRTAFEPPAEARWGLLDAAIGVAVLTIVLLAGQLIAQFVQFENPYAFQFVYSLIAYGLVVAYIVLVSFKRGQRSLAKDFGLAFKPIDVAIGLGLGIFAKILSAVFVLIASAITGALPQSGNVSLGPDPVMAALFGILIGSLLAPFVEELFFRGLVLRAVQYSVVRGPRRARPQPAASGVQKAAIAIALTVSAASFAAMHFQSGFDPALVISLLLSTFTFGLMNGAITLATKRLGSAIIAHIFFNGIAIAVLLLLGDNLTRLPEL